MSIERVRAYSQELGREGDILEFPVSSATVELAAQHLPGPQGTAAQTGHRMCQPDQ